jgi:hydrogenase expression/formation protein HypD
VLTGERWRPLAPSIVVLGAKGEKIIRALPTYGVGIETVRTLLQQANVVALGDRFLIEAEEQKVVELAAAMEELRRRPSLIAEVWMVDVAEGCVDRVNAWLQSLTVGVGWFAKSTLLGAASGAANAGPAAAKLSTVKGPTVNVDASFLLQLLEIDSGARVELRAQVQLLSGADTRLSSGDVQQDITYTTLQKAKARGGDIRMVYSSADAVALAQKHPDKQVVFFAIGFETTTPPTAVAIKQAAALGLGNFSVLCCHVLTPSAISSILESPEVRQWGTVPLDGFIGPAHVSTIIGSRPYEFFAEEYRKPVVIAGFEPLDVMQAVRMLVRQVNEGRAEVENEFSRAVSRDGNLKAQALVAEVFELRKQFEWRGLSVLPYSALRIRERFAAFDAELRYAVDYQPVADHKACECGAILRGVKRPQDCKLFGNVCTPENPIGSCMVSSEGACAAHYTYGRYKDV